MSVAALVHIRQAVYQNWYVILKVKLAAHVGIDMMHHAVRKVLPACSTRYTHYLSHHDWCANRIGAAP